MHLILFYLFHFLCQFKTYLINAKVLLDNIVPFDNDKVKKPFLLRVVYNLIYYVLSEVIISLYVESAIAFEPFVFNIYNKMINYDHF